jgi:hypothetical protein
LFWTTFLFCFRFFIYFDLMTTTTVESSSPESSSSSSDVNTNINININNNINNANDGNIRSTVIDDKFHQKKKTSIGVMASSSESVLSPIPSITGRISQSSNNSNTVVDTDSNNSNTAVNTANSSTSTDNCNGAIISNTVISITNTSDIVSTGQRTRTTASAVTATITVKNDKNSNITIMSSNNSNDNDNDNDNNNKMSKKDNEIKSRRVSLEALSESESESGGVVAATDEQCESEIRGNNSTEVVIAAIQPQNHVSFSFLFFSNPQFHFISVFFLNLRTKKGPFNLLVIYLSLSYF